MPGQNYEPLTPAADSDQEWYDDSSDKLHPTCDAISVQWFRKLSRFLLTMLGISLTANVLLVTKFRTTAINGGVSTFAGLKWDNPIPTMDEHRDIDDPMWDDELFDFTVGFVALDHKMAKKKGLIPAQNWPWDASKGVYVLKAFHSIHCVLLIRDVIRKYHKGEKPLWPHGHVTHCLHILRDDVTCMADDTPQYTGGLTVVGNKTVHIRPGTGQVRTCRDLNALRQYALEHSACYYSPMDMPLIPILDKYKHCRDGSKPWLGIQPANAHTTGVVA